MRKQRTRKQKALGRLPLLLPFLLLFVWNYSFSPRNAIRQAELLYNSGRTTVIRDLGGTGLPNAPAQHLYLSINKDALLWTTAEFSLRSGWHWDSAKPMDLTLGTSFQACECRFGTGERYVSEGGYFVGDRYINGDVLMSENRRSYLFGVAEDPDAVLVRAEVGYEDLWGWICLGELEIPQSHWIQAEGHTVFVDTLPDYNADGHWRQVEVRVWLLSETGETLAKVTASRLGGF